jgi:hypothetical protein
MTHPVHIPLQGGWRYVLAAPIEAGQPEALILWCQDHSHRWWVVVAGETTRRLTDTEAARANLASSSATPARLHSSLDLAAALDALSLSPPPSPAGARAEAVPLPPSEATHSTSARGAALALRVASSPESGDTP